MATAPTPPEANDEAAFAAEVMETLSIGDSPAPDREPPAPEGDDVAGEGAAAPAPSPDTPTEPVQPEAAPKPAAPAPAPAEPQPAEPPAAPAAPTPQPAAPPASPPSEEALRTLSLEAQVQALSGELERLRSQPPATPAAPGTPPAPESGQPQIQRYALTLPQQIAEGLGSDEPEVRAAATMQLVNDVATIVHARVVAQIGDNFNSLISAATADTTAQENLGRIEAGRQEYYAAYPAHKSPLYLPIIQAESAKLSTEYPNLPWGPEFMSSLGARVDAYVASLATPAPGEGDITPPPTPATPTPATPPARPAPSIPSGIRSAGVPGSEVEGEDLIMDTLT